MGNNFPWHHPLQNTHPGGSSNHVFYLAYIISILLAHSKSVTIKICEIKYLKNATLCKTSNRVDPAKHGSQQTRIELAMLDFRPDEKRALPAHRASDRIDGIVVTSLFGMRGFPPGRGPTTRILLVYCIYLI